jgi:hypothetical protein
MSNPAARNDGRKLEGVVEAIERQLLPSAFSVETNCLALDDDGNHVAEFDVVISGPLGSSSICWLIECRDRPSQGAAPANWVEQLVGRRLRFNADKVIAVSTTGFAPGAVEFAEKAGIILRTVENITDIEADFSVKNFVWTDDLIKVFTDFSYRIEGDHSITIGDSHRTLIRFGNSEEFRPLDDVVYAWVERQVIPDIERDSPVAVVTRHEYRPTEVAEFMIGSDCIRIKDLLVLVEVTAQSIRGEALLARRYKEGERVIGQIGEFKVNGPDGPFVCELTVTPRADGDADVTVSAPEGWAFDPTKFELLP